MHYSKKKSMLIFRVGKEVKKKCEETAFQRSCRNMATQHCNLSVVRIDLNALILQRREAVQVSLH